MNPTMSNRNFLSERMCYLFLFLTAFFIRLPFFFRDYIDRDESTFILMGQSIADGYLPYVQLWDLKPPLLFYVFGLIQYIFPDSFVAIRFLGVLVVFLSAVILMKISVKARLKNGFLTGLLYVILSSEFGNLQGLMSEHLAVLFVLAAMYFLHKKELSLYFFLSGIAFGCALLCKLSLAYGIFLYLLASFIMDLGTRSFRRLLISYFQAAAGILLPFAFLLTPYLLQDKGELFLNSVFLAPLEYSKAGYLSPLQKLANTWWIIAAGLLIAYFSLFRLRQGFKRTTILILSLLIGVIYTFYSSGIVNGHYLVQVYPFILLLVLGMQVKKEILLKPVVLGMLVVLVSAESLIEYYKVGKSIVHTGSPYYREAFTITRLIKDRKPDVQKIFFADYHIGYWLLNQYPLTKSTTHPSNLARPFLFKYFGVERNSLEELQFLMDSIQPDVVVSKTERLGFFPFNSSENIYFDSVIQKDFRPMMQPGKHVWIWERK